MDNEKAAAAEEPSWNHISVNKDVAYTIRVWADFEKKTVSYSIVGKNGASAAQKVNAPTNAVNLAKMISGSWCDSRPQTAPEEEPKLPLKGKTVYAFGDSIVAGHQYEQYSFADSLAEQEGVELQKFAVNGATMMDANYEGGQILSQIAGAPEKTPDYVLFDGGTNDAEYIAQNHGIKYGTVTRNMDSSCFEPSTFAGAFEKTVCEMKQKWPEAQFIYVAVHKLGSRDWETQEKLRDIELSICVKWEIAVADVYGEAELDTRNNDQKNKYTFDSVDSNGLPGTNGSGTHPNLAAIEEFYVPVVTEVLRNPERWLMNQRNR